MRALVWILLALLLTSVALNGWLWGHRADNDGRETDTVRITDTIVVREPVMTESVIVRTEYKWLKRVDTVFAANDADTIRDTVMVEIPIIQKVYEDSNYTAWISGYLPKLDSIRVYRHETVIRTKSRRWSLGVQTGYGITTKGFAPYVGVGFEYRLY